MATFPLFPGSMSISFMASTALSAAGACEIWETCICWVFVRPPPRERTCPA